MPDSWNTTEDKDQGKGINLLPEDLRSREASVLKQVSQSEPELRVPRREVLEKHEGKVPWFSFFSWFKREKKPKPKATAPAADKPKKQRLLFRILKDRRREQDELQRAKEEQLKKTIVEDVLRKPASNLPVNDNELMKQEQLSKLSGTNTAPLSDIYDESKVTIQSPVTPTPVAIPTPPEPQPEAVALPVVPAEPAPAPVPPIAETASTVVPPAPVADNQAQQNTHQPFHWPMSFNRDRARGFAVNLIPTSVTMRSWQQVSMILIWSFLAGVIIVGAMYGGLWWWGNSLQTQRSVLDDQIADVQHRIVQFEALRDDLSQTETTIRDMQMLLNQHVYWTKFFASLERFTLADVYFDGVSAGINGVMSFSAHAPDYLTAAKQVKLLQQPEALDFVLSASVNQMSGSEQGVSFTIDIVINPLLYYESSNGAQ